MGLGPTGTRRGIGHVVGAVLLAGTFHPHPLRAQRPTITIRFTATPPVIDGLVDDPAWQDAPAIENLTQSSPLELEAATERTVIRLLQDADHLYIGVTAYDSTPEGIVATQMERDRNLDPDDRVELVLDTFHDRRNAYFFQIGPGGSKGDALITNNGSSFDKDWDTIWEGKARITSEGWSAEFAIPFKSISFDPVGDTWGFNITRIIKRKRETDRWSEPRQNSGLFTIADAGDLTALSGMEQGIGLDFVPFFVGKGLKEHQTDREYLRGETGFDLFYKVTPGLTASLTVNTDFAETEVDDRQINLTRFPLFFPEKRDFFLQDKGIFEFGGIRRSPLPFFSRRIGLADGEEIPLIAGLRLTGRSGPYNVGILDVQTDEATIGGEGDRRQVGDKNLSVVRVSRNVLEQSQVGFITTRGDPTESGINALGGVDFTYRTSSFLDDRNLRMDLFGMTTTTSGPGGDGPSLGGTLRYPNDEIDLLLAFTHVNEEFDPGLGFVERKDMNRYEGEFELKPRLNTWVRRLEFGFNPVFVTDTGNHLETRELALRPIEVELDSGDRLRTEIENVRDILDEPFEIHDGIEIPVGTHDDSRYTVSVSASDKRPVSGRLRSTFGTFFTGKRTDWVAAIDARPSKHLTLSFENEENIVRLEEGSFTTRILRTRAQISFTPEISWNNFIQFDNDSDTVGMNSRFRWILTPGRELKLVLNKSWDRKGSDLRPLDTRLTFKAEYTVRF